jgi:hypothetical protein
LAKRISVDYAKPGQILAEELARHDGVLLAKEGSEVTIGLIRMLQRQNIETIYIEEEERRTREEIEEVHRANLARMNEAFRRVEGDSVLIALKKTLIFISEQERDKTLAVLELDDELENNSEKNTNEEISPPKANNLLKEDDDIELKGKKEAAKSSIKVDSKSDPKLKTDLKSKNAPKIQAEDKGKALVKDESVKDTKKELENKTVRRKK